MTQNQVSFPRQSRDIFFKSREDIVTVNMKPKSTGAGRGRPPKVKTVKKEFGNEETVLTLASEYQLPNSVKPSVEITKCISYQKFRYHGENRPGKKYQEKEFMTLKLSNLIDKVVRIVIICTDAENRELIHPNGLVGKDCHDGIYDKDYCLTKQHYMIKIPYLRTERIKTKKNEHEKIQSVLQERAMHLPSPYRERCLSQCTDKYTASRKFDTTKVCLGVIVTVLSHQGHYNGALHAISHVVRNASEKTILNILKLSETMVSAMAGGEIDIFTTEEGPAIEPEKYEVFVSYEGGGIEWSSDKISPAKQDILYKRVIRYQVPRFEPNPEIEGTVHVTLHLECPQSNQYCNHLLIYTSSAEVVVIDQDGTLKRSYVDESDLKANGKRMRLEATSETRGMDSIKANLKTKLNTKQVDYPSSLEVETVSMSQAGDCSSQYMMGHKSSLSDGSYNEQVLVTHHNPHTGEPSVLLDMDGSKPNGNNGIVLVNRDNNYAIHGIPLDRLNKASVKQTIQAGKGDQDVQVVATGYSDAVPPNTTVYIYTTNRGLHDSADHHLTIEETTGQQIVLQEVTAEESLMISDASSFVKSIGRTQAIEKQQSEGKTISTLANSNQVVHHELMRNNELSGKELAYAVAHSNADHSKTLSDVSQSDTQRSLSGGHFSSSSSSPSLAERFSSSITSSPSGIPHLRRMLIPSKMTVSSPWEVGSDEDSTTAAAYNIVVSNDMYSSYRSKALSQDTAVVKTEHNNQANYNMAESTNSPTERGTLQASGHVYMNGSTGSVSALNSGEKRAAQSNSEAGLTSMEFHLSAFVEKNAPGVDNLHTMRIAEMVENFEDNGEGEEETVNESPVESMSVKSTEADQS